MLPGLRFLFAATLICTSLLVFGMGAIALMRASHQQFASAPPRQPPEPVFAQAPATVPALSSPSLSMLRVDPAPPPLAEVAPADRVAALTSAERAAEPSPPQPVIAEPKPADPAETRSDAAPPSDPPPMPAVTPFAAAPAETGTPEAPAEDPSQQVAAAPAAVEAPALEPETTGSVSPPETAAPASDEVLPAAKPVADPPLPLARPQVAALPAVAEPVAKPAAKPAVKRKIRHTRRAKPKTERLPAVTSAPSLSSIFGGNSN